MKKLVVTFLFLAMAVPTLRAEQPAPQPTAVRKSWYLGLGPYFSTGMSNSSVMADLAIAYYFNVRPAVSLKLYLDAATSINSPSSTVSQFGLGADYLFTHDSDIAPYLGGEFGFGTAYSSLDRVNAFVLGVTAGVQFLRLSTVNLDIGGRFSVVTGSLATGVPLLFGLRIGICF